MSNKTVNIPNLGGADQVDVIEVMVAVGDQIEPEQSLITLEGDKASMDVPSPLAGEVTAILVKVGDQVSEGSPIIEVKISGDVEVLQVEAGESVEQVSPKEAKPSVAEDDSGEGEASLQAILVPDLGGTDQVDVIEVHIAPGDTVNQEDPIVTLEGDKASMDVPSPFTGTIESVQIKVGDRTTQGDCLAQIMVAGGETPVAVTASSASSIRAEEAEAESTPGVEEKAAEVKHKQVAAAVVQATRPISSFPQVHASPSIRRFARELGVDLTQVMGSGLKGRVVKGDVQLFVKSALSRPAGGMAIPEAEAIDFSQFGEIAHQPFNKIKRLTGAHMSRCWQTIPHVTQFGEVDITEMEAFRQAHKEDAQGIRLTPLAFIMQVLAQTLQEFPHFNASLDPSGEVLILKKYCHIGLAVETPAGLVVPVIRDVVGQSLFDLAQKMGEISEKARNKGLTPGDMQGGCMTISSLGGIGGTAFTPIVNAPEVAILGVSKSFYKPVYQDGEFVPRLILPLSLSYDHRVIDGAEGARFVVRFSELLADIRNLLL